MSSNLQSTNDDFKGLKTADSPGKSRLGSLAGWPVERLTGSRVYVTPGTVDQLSERRVGDV